MTPLPLGHHLPELERSVRQRNGVLLCLDFDGTLSPIVPHPEDATLLPGSREVLQNLTCIPGLTVAVVSGRALRDVQARVAIAGIVYAGNHGLEISGPTVHLLHPEAVAAEHAIATVCSRIEGASLRMPGVMVESKGLTASVHYRNAPAGLHAAVQEMVRKEVDALSDKLHLRGGNMVWEIRPNVRWHKGKAAKFIMERVAPEAWPIYIGDDTTDEDAFRELSDGTGIRVGHSNETAARYFVDSPADVLAFLRWIESISARSPLNPRRADPSLQY
jgi:trehalose 6-phosphate phosphatase